MSEPPKKRILKRPAPDAPSSSSAAVTPAVAPTPSVASSSSSSSITSSGGSGTLTTAAVSSTGSIILKRARAITTPSTTSSSAAAAAAIAPSIQVIPEVKYQIGGEGQATLRRLLTTDPRKVIPEFRRSNALVVGEAEPALDFLGLLGVKRADVFDSTIGVLCDQLISKLDTLSHARLVDLLERTFGYISVDELRRIPVALLERVQPVPKQYLTKLADSLPLLTKLPLPVRRQVWELQPALIMDVLKPLFVQFINDFNRQTIWNEMIAVDPLFRRRREHDTTLQAIVDIVGGSRIVYDHTIRAIRHGFTASGGHVGFAVLRVELSMALHDHQFFDVHSSDVCHSFAACMNVAINEQRFDGIVETMQQFLRSLPSNTSVIGDVCMMARHPLFVHVVCADLLRALDTCVDEEAQPQDSKELLFFSDLLALTTNTRSEAKSLPSTPKSIKNEFYALITELLVLSKLEETEPLNPKLTDHFEMSSHARLVLYYYLISRVHAGDRDRVLQLAPLLAKVPSFPWHHVDQSFVHSLISSLSQRTSLVNDVVRSAVCDMMVAIGGKTPFGYYQLLRAIHHLSKILPADEAITWLKQQQRWVGMDEPQGGELPSLSLMAPITSLQTALSSIYPTAAATIRTVTASSTAAAAPS